MIILFLYPLAPAHGAEVTVCVYGAYGERYSPETPAAPFLGARQHIRRSHSHLRPLRLEEARESIASDALRSYQQNLSVSLEPPR